MAPGKARLRENRSLRVGDTERAELLCQNLSRESGPPLVTRHLLLGALSQMPTSPVFPSELGTE